MPRVCSICAHPKRAEIDTALVDGITNRHIAAQFSLAPSSLSRHRREHLPQTLANAGARALVPKPSKDATETAHAAQVIAAAEDQIATNIDILGNLAHQLERINLLSDAVDRWLRDPEDESRYDISPRSDEIQVVYLDGNDPDQHGNPRRKRCSLGELLIRVEQGSVIVQRGEIKYADPRTLLMSAADGLKGQLGLVLTVLEKLHNAQEIEAFEAAVMDAIAEVAPDVRDRIHDNLRRRQPLRRSTGPPLG